MLSRESGEELAEETTSLQKDFPVDLLRVKDSHQYLKLSSWEQDLAPLTQAQLFRVYDLHGTREAFALFEQISSIPGDEILWVSRNDILDGRCSVHNKPIGAPCELFIRNSIRSEEHTSELQSLMRISYAVFCLKKKKKTKT